MKGNSRFPVYLGIVLAQFGVAACAAEPSSWPESGTVEELLRLDARSALKAEQDRLARLSASAIQPLAPRAPFAGSPAPKAKDVIRVLAIYGVGQQLSADVLINGRRYRYRQGMDNPAGAVLGTPLYALVRIEGGCVTLKRQSAHRKTCLRPSQEARR